MIYLRGLTWNHPRGFGPLVGLGALYTMTHPGVAVHWEARSLQAFGDLSPDRLADDYDLLVIDHPHVPVAAEGGLLVELDAQARDGRLERLADQSVGASHESYRHNGHQYALAIDAAAQVAAHRPDLLEAPPKTWEEVDALVNEGRVLWPGKPADAMSSFLTLLANQGQPICATQDKAVAYDAGRTALSRLHRLAGGIPEHCLQEDPVAVAERLARSDQWVYAPLLYGYTNYSRRGFREHRLAYTAPPLGPGTGNGSCLGGAGIAVSTRSRHTEAAVEYAYWLASAEVQAGGYYHHGGQPANVAAWEDPVVNDDSLNFFGATRQTVEQASLRPRAAWWPDLQNEIGDLVNRALRGELTDRDCLERISEAHRHLVRASGR